MLIFGSNWVQNTILPQNNGKVHRKLEVIAGFASFSIPLLWEDSVWFSALQVDAVTKSKGELMAERRDPICRKRIISRALVRVDEGSSGLGDSTAAKGDGDVGVVPWKIKFNPMQKENSRYLPKKLFKPLDVQDYILTIHFTFEIKIPLN